jgi:hypothetical protein
MFKTNGANSKEDAEMTDVAAVCGGYIPGVGIEKLKPLPEDVLVEQQGKPVDSVKVVINQQRNSVEAGQ